MTVVSSVDSNANGMFFGLMRQKSHGLTSLTGSSAPEKPLQKLQKSNTIAYMVARRTILEVDIIRKSGRIIKCRQYKSQAQVKSYVSPKIIHGSNSMGQPVARQLFKQHIQLRVRNCGLWVSHYDFLAASPDGITWSRWLHQEYIPQINCYISYTF